MMLKNAPFLSFCGIFSTLRGLGILTLCVNSRILSAFMGVSWFSMVLYIGLCM